ncbi:hypothetical protein CYMTET_40515 [Cymbomonas tetramitiformis]|uniref:Integrase catalytic domain-containing protein n=1 Tax=Cymbomonas tetramitiformis TaxID=36881 RepID=A0AAE0F4J3_9CHLO|nr:hypothetical protein CYMTET_40515 [Cymbomonas tetramitiformis]
MSAKVPVINVVSMDDGDFTPFALEVNAYRCDIITNKNLKRFSAGSGPLEPQDINKLKAMLFKTSLQTMFRSTTSECEAARAFLLEPNADGKIGVQLILEDGDDYPATAGFMTEPLTSSSQLPSAAKAQKGLQSVVMQETEDPSALSCRVQRLALRINRAHRVPVITDENAATYLLNALPGNVAGIARERMNRTIAGHEDYTLAEVTELVQTVFDELRKFQDKILRSTLEQSNLEGYVSAFSDGPTRSVLQSMLKPTASKSIKPTNAPKPLVPARTSTTSGNLGRVRPPAGSVGAPPLNDAGKKLLLQLTDGKNAGSFATSHDTSSIAANTRGGSAPFPGNVGGPDGSCKFYHRSLAEWHCPDLPCHFSGRTALYDSWVNQGRMPNMLRPFVSQLIVNHDRISKNKEPLSRSDEFLKQYCDKAGELAAAEGASYHTAPPPSTGAAPSASSTAAPKSHAEFLQWFANVPAAASHHASAASSDEHTIPHFHSYAFGIDGATPYSRSPLSAGASTWQHDARPGNESSDMDVDPIMSGAGDALVRGIGGPAIMGRRRRVCLEMAALSTALINHQPSGEVKDTFRIAYQVIPLFYPEYPLDPRGKAVRLGRPELTACYRRVHDKHGLPTCCMSCRSDSDNWEAAHDVVDLVSDSDSSDSEAPLSPSQWSYDTPTSAYDGLVTEPTSPTTPQSRHSSYMARSMVNHQPIPASFRRLPVGEVSEVANPAVAAAVRGRVQPSPEDDAAASLVLMSKEGWIEEDYDDHVASLSVMTTPAEHRPDQVPGAELQRLTAKAAEDMNPAVVPWFRRESICYTLSNSDPKRSILVMNQKTGLYKVFKVMIVDTGSMLFVMNKKHVGTLGITTQPGQATVDTSLGSKDAQRHTQWGAGELMLVVAPGTSNELVLADVTGISPEAHVNFDVLLSVDILHAMSAGILPATPQREAALVYHPRNQQGDFATKAYLPLRTLKVSGPSAPGSFMTQLVEPGGGSPTVPAMRELTSGEKELSLALLRVRSAKPWNSSMVAVDKSPRQTEEGLDVWGYQSLDSSGYARLCRRLSVAFGDEPVEVEFLRCGSRKTVCTKVEDPVRQQLQKLQDSFQSVVSFAARPGVGVLMWDLEMREFCVRPLAVQQQLEGVVGQEPVGDLHQHLVLPHFYEERGQFHHQLLGNLVKPQETQQHQMPQECPSLRQLQTTMDPLQWLTHPVVRVQVRSAEHHHQSATFGFSQCCLAFAPCSYPPQQQHRSALEAWLVAGGVVKQYVYCDRSVKSRQMAEHRLVALHNRFPDQLPLDALQCAFSTFPQDLRRISQEDMEGLAATGLPMVAIVGTECQDLSAAGSQQGLRKRHSAVLYDVVHVVGTLQKLVGRERFMYLIECVAAQYNFNSQEVREVMHPLMCSMIGMPITIDAARLGSRAHRLRNYWTNMASYVEVQEVVDGVQRDQARLVRDILDPGHREQPAAEDVAAAHYPCNRQGEPMRAWPTIMSFPKSFQFRDSGLGTVWDEATQQWTEPTPEEKERAMGFQTGATDAPGVTAQERGEALGRAFDIRCVSRLMALCQSVNRGAPPRLHVLTPAGAAERARQATVEENGVGTEGVCTPSARVPSQWAASLSAISQSAQQYAACMRRLYGRGATRELVNLPPSQHPDVGGQFPGDKTGLGAAGVDFGIRNPASDKPIEFVPAREQCSACFACTPDEDVGTPYAAPETNLTHALSAAAETREMIEPITDQAMLQWLRGERQGTPEEQAAVASRARHYQLEGDTLVRILPNGARRPVPPVEHRRRIVQQMHERLGHFGQRRTAAMVRDAFYWPNLISTCKDVVSRCDSCARYKANFDKQSPQLNPLESKGMYYRFSADLAKMPRKAKSQFQYVMVVVEHYTKYVCLIPLRSKEPAETAQAFALHVIGRFGCPAEVLTDNGGEWEKDFAKLLEENLIDHRTTSQSHPQSNGLSERVVQTVKAALTKACAKAGSIDQWDRFLPWIMLGYNATPQESTRLSPYELVHAQKPTLPPSIKQRMSQPLDNLLDPDLMAEEYLQRAEYVKRAAVMAGSNIAIAQHRQTERYAQVKSLPVSGTVELQGRCGSTCKVHCSQVAICHFPDIDPTITYNLDDNEDARRANAVHGVVPRGIVKVKTS